MRMIQEHERVVPDFDSSCGHDCYFVWQIKGLWVLPKTPMYAEGQPN